jgi:uncharacterized BrkB/YihY/UPF0761 family membrane protein
MKGHSSNQYSPADDKVGSSEGSLSLLLLTLFFIVAIILCAQLNCMIEHRREAYYDKRDRDRQKEKDRE